MPLKKRLEKKAREAIQEILQEWGGLQHLGESIDKVSKDVESVAERLVQQQQHALESTKDFLSLKDEINRLKLTTGKLALRVAAIEVALQTNPELRKALPRLPKDDEEDDN